MSQEPVDFSSLGLTEEQMQMFAKLANDSITQADDSTVGSDGLPVDVSSEMEVTFDQAYKLLKKYSLYKGEYCDNILVGTGTVAMGKDMFGGQFIQVSVQYYAPFGAKKYTLCTKQYNIKQFGGKVKFKELAVEPIPHPESSDLICAMLTRGTQFVEFTQKPYYAHANGFMYVPIYGGFKRCPINSRVVIDPDGYQKFCNANRWFSKSTISEVPAELIHMTMPTVPVFSLEYRMWGEIPVLNMGSIMFDKTAFDRTVLPQAYKDTLSPLVANFYNTNCVDFIAGKKKGLVFLLGGKPGTGKTLTAQAIAELNEKPLYCIGSGDLGTKPNVIDTNLQRIFNMVEKWGGMVLIDEADVFMSRRTDYNVDYNACVSVFLRLIENYFGILFLTTNKEHIKIDPAFDSRVHIRLHYRELDAEGRSKVWTESTNRYGMKELDIDVLKEYKLNNREIAHIVQLAYIACNGDGEKVTTDKILEFIKLRVEFDPTEDYDTIKPAV
jgi:hypothetical protein